MLHARKHEHFIWCATPMSNMGHFLLLHACPNYVIHVIKKLQDTVGTLIFYFFLVSILNTYLVIFYLLFWFSFLVCILIYKYHLLVKNLLYYPLLLLN